MKKIIHIQRLTLKCDACGHKHPEPVTLDREWIGTPCPACGANMLSEGDYQAAARFEKLADMANRIFGPWLGTETPSDKADLYRVNPRGPHARS